MDVATPDSLVITEPMLGFVCLDPAQEPALKADMAALTPHFRSHWRGRPGVRRCHVLFIYCNVAAEGALAGVEMRIRDVIRLAGARIAVIASAHAPECYRGALEPENDWPANIVLVSDRKGVQFGEFFQTLFGAMRAGSSMVEAWRRLVQLGGYRDAPAAILVAEAGPIRFA